MADYKQVLDLDGTISSTIIRVADATFIPADEDNTDYKAFKAWIEAGNIPDPPDVPAAAVPDGPTLSDWRVGLLLWGRRDDLLARVAAEVGKGTVIGKIADERVNYANNVYRAQLVQLRAVFNFTEAEVDESLWRADRVSKGDLSGVWPLASR